MKTMKYRKLVASAFAAVVIGGGAVGLASPAAAQGGGAGFIMNYAACSTIDTTEVAAKVLTMTAAELRAALVGGKTLSDVAKAKGVTVEALQAALTEARNAEIDQAVADGLLTQEQADALKNNTPIGRMGRTIGQPPANSEATPAAPETGSQPVQPGEVGRVEIMVVSMGGGHMGGQISPRNTVKPAVVAAAALGVSCADLVKALDNNTSIATYAQSKGVALQTVIDALVKAYTEAIDKDVAEGLIAPASVEGEKSRILDRVLNLLARSGGGFEGDHDRREIRMEGMGGGGMPGMPGMPGRDGQGGQPGQPGRKNN
ncbi:MAG TPA: hypothetical protein PLD47_05400 [Aggregatilineales bacterium]|nr:hypothetical protein [Anaerolineales bacterium]HRE47141.1 hypothetical protein [Aggregatilineales bacterium]